MMDQNSATRGRSPRRRRAWRIIPAISMSLALLSAGPLRASPKEPDDDVEEVIQELFLGETVYSQDRLELQLTSALSFVHTPAGGTFIAAPFFELGLTERFQIGAELPIESARLEGDGDGDGDGGRALGVGNVSVGALFNAYNSRKRGFALSFALEGSFPAASGSVGEPAWGVSPVIIAYKALGPVHMNLALAAEVEIPTGDDEDVGLSPSAALGLFLPVGPVVPTLELLVTPLSSPTLTAAAGALVHPSPALEIGLALKAGLDGLDEPSFGASLMATWETDFAGEPEEEQMTGSVAR